jgi:uncharacterized protein (DUF934 family)
MRRILRQREVVTDDWRHLSEAQPVADAQAPGAQPSESGAGPKGSDPRRDAAASLIVPFAEFRANTDLWRSHQGRLGVRLAPADSVEELAASLPLLSLVAVEFPSPAEGRGYTQGRLLRSRFHFKGELRAVGAGVKQDLIFLMARCGFDAFELAADQTFEEAIKALSRYTVAYQPAEPLEAIRAQRFFAAS